MLPESDSLMSVSANPERDELQIPLLGVIAAGIPIQSYLPPETLFVPADMCSPTRFALKVRGESMKDEQIADGDFIVAELIDDTEATVKKFYDERAHIRLQLPNDEFERIIVKPPRRVKIQGIVVGLIRKFR